MKTTLILIIISIMLTACGPSQADIQKALEQTQTAAAPTITPTPALSDDFINKVNQFLDDATRLTVMTEQGVNYIDFKDQLTTVKTSYGIAKEEWPNSFPSTFTNGFNQAIDGWDWTLYLWGLKIDKSDNPVEPDINGYVGITTFGGDALIIDTHPDDYIVEGYRGMKFLPFDENIGVLMTLATGYFNDSKKELKAAMP